MLPGVVLCLCLNKAKRIDIKMKALDFIGLIFFTEKIRDYITKKFNLLKTATKTSSWLMSANDKKKLDGIADGATNTAGLMITTDKTKLDGL